MSRQNRRKKPWGPGLVITLLLIILVAEFIGVLAVTKLIPVYLLFVIGIVMMTVVVMVGFLTGDNRKKARFIIGAILAILMVAGIVIGNLYVLKTYNTLSIISDVNTKSSSIGVYVKKDDPANSIFDAKDYTFGTLSGLDEENTAEAVNQITKEVAGSIEVKEVGGVTELIDALRNGDCQAIILNSAYIPVLDDMEGYENIEDEMKEINIQVVSLTLDANKKQGVTADLKEIENDNVLQFYISGVDTRNSMLVNSRSDVNIIATVNTDTHQVLLISTPRDFYVPLSISNGVPDKLTHAGIYGVDCSMDTLSMLYDIKISNYFRVNFTGFVKIIDAMGGITVNSDYDFTSDDHYHYTVGENELNGEEALSFARERHAFAQGDRQRGRDQMLVIQAVIKKATSPDILSSYTSILSAAENCFDTDLSYDRIAELVRQQLEDGRGWDVITYSVDGSGASEKPYSLSTKAYVMIPDETTIEKAKALIDKMAADEKISQEEADSDAPVITDEVSEKDFDKPAETESESETEEE